MSHSKSLGGDVFIKAEKSELEREQPNFFFGEETEFFWGTYLNNVF